MLFILYEATARRGSSDETMLRKAAQKQCSSVKETQDFVAALGFAHRNRDIPQGARELARVETDDLPAIGFTQLYVQTGNYFSADEGRRFIWAKVED